MKPTAVVACFVNIVHKMRPDFFEIFDFGPFFSVKGLMICQILSYLSCTVVALAVVVLN